MTISSAVAIANINDIPLGEGRTFTVEGEMIAVFRLRDGSLRAVSAVCPHKGGPLADGQIDNRIVVCPLHLFSWDLATGCSQSGQPPINVYPVRVDGDLIVLGE
ncbi:Rieske 2Fe-2S domain-containing protein [Actinoplanes missouriensis]|uniref:Rieske (2Fe-2S) protein n=1 Tax=Actinoplanes missouriensis TaxID=1866 RepID=UPI0033F56163